MSVRNSATPVLCAVLFLSLLLFHAPEMFAQGYYSYDQKTGAWVWVSTAWKSSNQKALISISVNGFSSEFSVAISVDGKEAGTVPGGGSKDFEVDKKSSHAFRTAAEVSGPCVTYEGKNACTRYKCPRELWTAALVESQTCQDVYVCRWVLGRRGCAYEQQCYTTTDFAEKRHTFEYHAEHELLISDPHGQNADEWYREGANVVISAKEFAVTREESDVREWTSFRIGL